MIKDVVPSVCKMNPNNLMVKLAEGKAMAWYAGYPTKAQHQVYFLFNTVPYSRRFSTKSSPHGYSAEDGRSVRAFPISHSMFHPPQALNPKP